jgi:transcriptional regulator with XRE-family HTH domain
MKEVCSNIYQYAREYAGLTQEQASEQLFISVRALAGYEGGKVIPKDDIVLNMISVYKFTPLGYLHLQQTEIGQQILPGLSLDNISSQALRYTKETNDVMDCYRELQRITYDDVSDHHETDIWQGIMSEVKEQIQTGFNLMFSAEVWR